jgi:hypothetical protein
MVKKIAAIAFIYACCVVAWLVLGGTVRVRTYAQEAALGPAVGQLWGGEQVQAAPRLERLVEAPGPAGPLPAAPPAPPVRTAEPAALAASALDVGLRLEHRRKGLLWYPTYRVRFAGRYRVANPTDERATYRFRFRLPEQAAVFDHVTLAVAGAPAEALPVEGGELVRTLTLAPGEAREVRVGYGSQGVGTWRYGLGEGVASVRAFRLAMTTDFDRVDFPAGTLSPTHKRRTDEGWALTWDYGTLVADADVGLALPQRLNPGPWVSRVTFFAPVSLFLFFFVVFVQALLRGVRLHPMHYFFLGCAFFAFHLLLAYLVDHVAVPFALAVSSLVSVGLVWSYVRLVAGPRFALTGVGVPQLVYLVGFAYTFFLEGFTGLAVTGLSVGTLFVVMQATGRMDWERLLARPPGAGLDPVAVPQELSA